MAYNEIDSFVEKFKNLWHSGLRATLNVEAEYGKASVTLKAGLGFIPPPFPAPRQHRGPAYQRRQHRRQAARTAAGHSTPAEQEGDDQVSEIDIVNSSVSYKVTEEVTLTPTVMETNKNEAEQAPADFNCTICDFKSKWKNGLSVHMTRKHHVNILMAIAPTPRTQMLMINISEQDIARTVEDLVLHTKPILMRMR